MKLINFPEMTTVIAKDQPQYQPFPAHIKNDPMGTTIAAWELSDEEIEMLIHTRTIWHSIWTFHRKLQPQLLSVEKPEMENKNEK